MRNFLRNFMVGLITLIGGFTTVSCDNSLTYEPNPNDSIQVQLVRTPDVVAYSGEQVWGSTFGTRTVNLPMMYMTRSNSQPDVVIKVQDNQQKGEWMLQQDYWKGYYESFDNAPKTSDRGESVSTSEYNEVMSYLLAHPNEGYDEVDLSTYFLQNVGSAGHQYTTTPDQNGVTHTTGMQMDYFNINGWHVNDYNAQGGPRIYVENWSLENCSYHDSFGNNTFNYYKFYYIPLSDGTVGLYLCFDYATISQQGNVEPDGTYDDWVIKIIPANGTVTPPVETPEQPENPDVVIPEKTPEHVEVNLAVEDHNDWLSTHLSIHVRANTNVEIFIPIDSKYICEPDDLAIVNKHLDNEMLHGGPTSIEYNVGGHIVTLNVERHFGENYDTQGLRIWTEGITQEVIDYCQETYGDGITFEIWNYFNTELFDRDSLRDYLKTNNSTIKFLNNCPDLYVNAFFNGYENQFDYDCPVIIEDSQSDGYHDYKDGWWYNGSETNHLYEKK